MSVDQRFRWAMFNDFQIFVDQVFVERRKSFEEFLWFPEIGNVYERKFGAQRAGDGKGDFMIYYNCELTAEPRFECGVILEEPTASSHNISMYPLRCLTIYPMVEAER